MSEALALRGRRLFFVPGANRMPFESKAQMRFMYAKHPRIAKRWSKKYGTKGLPERKRRKR